MGKRARRRQRGGSQEVAKTSRYALRQGQQMARINVSDDSWTEFRIEAMRAHRSVADYLGHLVDKEVARISRRNDRAPRDSDSEVPDWEL